MHVVNAFKLGHGHKYRQDRVCSQGIKTELYDTDTQLGLIGTEDLSCPGPWSQCHSLCCGLSCAMSDGDNVWSIMRIAT